MSTTGTTSWVEVPDESPFPITNLPYGVAELASGEAVCVVAIGDHVLPLASLAATGLLDQRETAPSGDPLWADGGARTWFAGPTLDKFLRAGRPAWTAARAALTRVLSDAAYADVVGPLLVERAATRQRLPFTLADYVDFYSSEQHALNVGAIFRPDNPGLPAAWKHLPIGYHGRAGTVVISGTDVVRPTGQWKMPSDPGPAYGPEPRLDIEAEVGFVVGGRATEPGTRVPTSAIRDHVLGVVLVNDWSARAIQAFEYVPLGPFLGKSFLTSVSPWIVSLDALHAAMIAPPVQDPAPPAYLADAQWGLDLELEVRVNGSLVARPPFRDMYWTPAQQLAHLTVNGATLRPGDLFASGTVSGARPEEFGSFLERSWNGAKPFAVGDGTRGYLEDGDTVTITATAPGAYGTRIGFGEVTGVVRPARP